MAGQATDDQELRLLERPTSRTRLHWLHRPQDDESSDLGLPAKNLSMIQTVLLMSAQTSGYGSMVIAVLVVSTGWLGLVTSGLIYSTVIFTLVLIERCWNMVRDKYPTERHPYGAIGFEAYGGRARTIMNVLLVSCCFVSGAALPLAASELLLLIGCPALRGYFCYFPLAIGFVVCLLTWLKTPKDIWLFSFASFTCNFIAFMGVFIGLVVSGGRDESNSAINGDTHKESLVLHHAEMIRTVTTVTAIHYVLPTLQQDMKEPSSGGKVVLLTAGDFSWKRLVLRPLVILLQIFLQESVPHINLYFAIIGGCFLPPLALFAPPLCYLRLKSLQLQESGVGKTPRLFLLETVICWVIMGITPLVMVAFLYVMLAEMLAGRTIFTVPCYVNATLARP